MMNESGSFSATDQNPQGQDSAVTTSGRGVMKEAKDRWRDELCVSLVREDCDRVRRGLVQLRSDMNSTISVGMASVGLLVSAGATALQANTTTAQVLAAADFLLLLPAFCTVMAVLYYSAADQQQQGGLYLLYREELLNRMARSPAEVLQSIGKPVSDLPMVGESILWEAYRRCEDVDIGKNAPGKDSFRSAHDGVSRHSIFAPMNTRQRRYPYIFVLASFFGAAVVTWCFGISVAGGLMGLISSTLWTLGCILACSVLTAVILCAVLIILGGLRLR